MRRRPPAPRQLTSAVAWTLILVMSLPLASTILGWSRRPPEVRLPTDLATPPGEFEPFLRGRLARSRSEGARPGNEERLIPSPVASPPFAILYIHGFVASRAEGEPVVASVARRFGVPAYFLRLPGHGTRPDDLGERGFREWIEEAARSLHAVQALAPKVVVVGTSMGGAIATYLAARRPEWVDALVLASPFFAFRDPTAEILTLPGGLSVAEALLGPERRVPLDPDDPEDHRIPGFEDHWYAAYPLSAVRELAQVARLVDRREILTRVGAPSLLLYYHRDEEHQDVAASVAAMRRAHRRFPDGPTRREVAIAEGDHVLLSSWVRADLDRAEEAIVRFLEDVFPGPVPATDPSGDRDVSPDQTPTGEGGSDPGPSTGRPPDPAG